MKFISWNVNGIRAIYKKGFEEFVAKRKPDILCLQEIKISEELLSQIQLKGYTPLFSPALKKGYSGVATFLRSSKEIPITKIKRGIGKPIFDEEGRFLITYHKDFRLYNLYMPSGTTGEKRQLFKYRYLDEFYSHLCRLPKSAREKTILCGDFNICHKEIDIHHPREATRRELSGFLPEERAWIDSLVSLGFTDSFRHIHGAKKAKYSWWTYRAGAREKNLGWRIDYFFVGEAIKKQMKKASLLENVYGSDHCPIELDVLIKKPLKS